MSKFDQLDPTTIVNPRIEGMAYQHGEEVSRTFRERFADQTGEDEFELIVIKAAAQARRRFIADYLTERLAGLHNDVSSTAPGLDALIKPEAVQKFIQSSESDNTGGLRPSEDAELTGWIDEALVANGLPPLREPAAPVTLSDIEWSSLQHRGSMPPFFSSVEVDGVEAYIMSLPVGAFREERERLLFTTRASFQDDRIADSDAWFVIPQADVYEIRGKAGDFWKQRPAQPPTLDQAS